MFRIQQAAVLSTLPHQTHETPRTERDKKEWRVFFTGGSVQQYPSEKMEKIPFFRSCPEGTREGLTREMNLGEHKSLHPDDFDLLCEVIAGEKSPVEAFPKIHTDFEAYSQFIEQLNFFCPIDDPKNKEISDSIYHDLLLIKVEDATAFVHSYHKKQFTTLSPSMCSSSSAATLDYDLEEDLMVQTAIKIVASSVLSKTSSGYKRLAAGKRFLSLMKRAFEKDLRAIKALTPTCRLPEERMSIEQLTFVFKKYIIGLSKSLKYIDKKLEIENTTDLRALSIEIKRGILPEKIANIHFPLSRTKILQAMEESGYDMERNDLIDHLIGPKAFLLDHYHISLRKDYEKEKKNIFAALDDFDTPFAYGDLPFTCQSPSELEDAIRTALAPSALPYRVFTGSNYFGTTVGPVHHTPFEIFRYDLKDGKKEKSPGVGSREKISIKPDDYERLKKVINGELSPVVAFPNIHTDFEAFLQFIEHLNLLCPVEGPSNKPIIDAIYEDLLLMEVENAKAFVQSYLKRQPVGSASSECSSSTAAASSSSASTTDMKLGAKSADLMVKNAQLVMAYRLSFDTPEAHAHFFSLRRFLTLEIRAFEKEIENGKAAIARSRNCFCPELSPNTEQHPYKRLLDELNEQIRTMQSKLKVMEERTLVNEIKSFKKLHSIASHPDKENLVVQEAQTRLSSLQEEIIEAMKESGYDVDNKDLIDHLIGPKNFLLEHYNLVLVDNPTESKPRIFRYECSNKRDPVSFSLDHKYPFELENEIGKKLWMTSAFTRLIRDKHWKDSIQEALLKMDSSLDCERYKVIIEAFYELCVHYRINTAPHKGRAGVIFYSSHRYNKGFFYELSHVFSIWNLENDIRHDIDSVTSYDCLPPRLFKDGVTPYHSYVD